MTTRTPGRVTEDSATLVASTTRRCPDGSGCSTRLCASTDSSPCSGSTCTAGSSTSCSAPCTRAISRWPGRNTSTSPGCVAKACSTARRVCGSSASSRRAGKCAISTGKLRPALLRRGASTKPARRSPSSVADIATMRRSSRTCACTSSASARPRSPARWRSWNSSNSSAPTCSSIGSSWISRVRMPSVTTSMRVRAEVLFSKRMR